MPPPCQIFPQVTVGITNDGPAGRGAELWPLGCDSCEIAAAATTQATVRLTVALTGREDDAGPEHEFQFQTSDFRNEMIAFGYIIQR